MLPTPTTATGSRVRSLIARSIAGEKRKLRVRSVLVILDRLHLLFPHLDRDLVVLVTADVEPETRERIRSDRLVRREQGLNQIRHVVPSASRYVAENPRFHHIYAHADRELQHWLF